MTHATWHDLYLELSSHADPYESFHDFLKKKCGIQLVFKGDKIEAVLKNKKQFMIAKLKYGIKYDWNESK